MLAMNHRWIRIDRAHRAFDCSESEFDAVLSDAESVSGLPDGDSQEILTQKNSQHGDEFDQMQLVEAINSELAQLAALQRRDRFVKRQRELSKQQIEQTRHGQLLAKLHASQLKSSS